jgi:hypothetical protein
MSVTVAARVHRRHMRSTNQQGSDKTVGPGFRNSAIAGARSTSLVRVLQKAKSDTLS